MEPKLGEIDGSTVSKNRHSHFLPYTFRGRDFNATNDIFLNKLLEFHETWFRDPDINNKNVPQCKCPAFLKCQHLIVNNPYILTSEFAQKTWMEILSKQNQNNINIQCKPIHVGHTSVTLLIQLVYDDAYPLITAILLDCHVDLSTNKSIPICNAKRYNINNQLKLIQNRDMKEYQNLLKFREDFINAMNKFDNIKHCKQYLFETELQIFYTDIDINFHVNQSVYGSKIENALFLYFDNNGFIDCKYKIKDITINYLNEMRIDRNKSKNTFPVCTVKIIKDNKINDYKDIKREIFGVIEKDNKLCIEWRVSFVTYKHDRYFALYSRL